MQRKDEKRHETSGLGWHFGQHMPKVNLRFNYWYKKPEAAAWSENKWYVWLHDCQMITWLSIGMSCEKILNELDTLNYPKGIKDFYGWFTPDNNAKGEANIINS